jgi:predicted nucleotidyltransferase component of viral defense system
MVELFSKNDIKNLIAIRGGAALYKFYFKKPERYSEDIDLVQVEAGPIGLIMDGIHQSLDLWLGKPKRQQGQGRVTLLYRFMTETEPIIPMRLKVEINTREHFAVLGFAKHHFAVSNRWFSGSADVNTYHLEELLATKLRALYQRKKGRDLYDLWAASRNASVDVQRLVNCFQRYLENDRLRISRAEFEANLHSKLSDPGFGDDINPLLASEVKWDQMVAADYLFAEILPLLPGEPWKGGVKNP